MAYAKLENLNLSYLEEKQNEIRAELYQILFDAVSADDQTRNIGQQVVLPSSFSGSPRDMHQRYQDTMTIVCYHSKPDVFIMITCNPD